MGKKVKRSRSSRLKPNEPVLAGGRSKRPARRKALRTGQPARKIVTQNQVGVFSEADIETNDRFSRVLFDPEGRMLEGSRRAAREARVMVQSALLVNVERLLRLSLHEKDSATKKWAGEVLAFIGSRITVEDRKLLKENKSYRTYKRRIGKKLGTVLYPKATISRIVQVELSMAESVGDLLAVLDFTCGEWEQEAKRLQIRECYWPVMDLPELSPKSEPRWWKFLWRLIKKNYPDLLLKLRNESVANDKKGWSTFRRQFRQHLQLLARRRTQGVRNLR